MDNKTKGYFYAIISQLIMVAWPIFSFMGMNTFNVHTTIVLWFGFAAISSLVMIMMTKKTNLLPSLFKIRQNKMIFFWLGAEVLTTTVWFSLYILGPSLNTFLSKISILITIILGIFLLKETFSIKESIAAIIMVLGVFLITFATGDYVLKGILMIIIFGISVGLCRFFVKKYFEKIDPLVIIFYRALTISFFYLIFSLIIGKFKIFPSISLIYSTIPAFFTAVVSHIFIYKSIKLLDISKFELIGTMYPFMVLFTSFLIFGEILTMMQFIGGCMIAIGIIILVYVKKTKKYIKNKNKK